MDCQALDPLLYDRLTERLTATESQAVDAHLAHCPGCRATFEELKQTLAVLDTWTVPDPSPDFHNRLLARATDEMEAAMPRQKPPTDPVAAPASPRPRSEPTGLAAILRRFQLPIVGLAVAATMIGGVVLYQGFGPDEQQAKQTMRGLQLELSATPIVIKTLEPDKTLSDLRTIVQFRGGRVVREQPTASGIEVTLKIAQRDEPALLRELGKLGSVSVPTGGYKDSDGNLIVMVRQSETFPP